MTTSFSDRILAWFATHGRHDLPWQQHHKTQKDPYSVWVSEIMLQQTQVSTVIGYFNRFMTEFPTLTDLATAPLETVLENWAGLGYYARARNLHKTAQELQKILKKTNAYPQSLDDWQSLAGIGRSTAGAIMAMGLGNFGVICDGNVKRVLTRHFGIDKDITKPATDKILWELATQLTPQTHSGLYAQAMMDMGATVCTRTRPKCESCPIADTCIAHQNGTPTAYPVKTKKNAKPTHHSLALLICHDHHTLWLKRPNDGVWGGLWCLPLLSNTLSPALMETTIADVLGLTIETLTPTTSLRHTLSHFHWQLSLVKLTIDVHQFHQLNQRLAHANDEFEWYNKDDTFAKPTAMVKLLEIL